MRSFHDFICFSILMVATLAAPPGMAQIAGREAPIDQNQIIFSFSPIVKQTAPAVVNVYATKMIRQRRSPLMDDPFFRDFFGRRGLLQQRPRSQDSLGSGVIVRASGMIVTNNHVIDGADMIRIGLSDGREFDVEVVLADPTTDLAILEVIDPRDETFPFLEFAQPDSLEVGDLVLAIGNPFGVGQTVSSGIVSALDRTRLGIADISFFIQTDAPINPGNSGGPLVDMTGRIVGINTAIFSRTGTSAGVGFSIPAVMADRVLQAAIQGEGLVRPWIGGTFENINAELAEAIGLERPRGAFVVEVNPDGPLDLAGITQGDVILNIDGRDISDYQSLQYRLATKKVNDEIELEIMRDTQNLTFKVKLQPVPVRLTSSEVVITGDSPFAGLTVKNLDTSTRRRLQLNNQVEGVFIRSIDQRSVARRSGLRPGDVIVSVNQFEVANVDDLSKALQSTRWLWRLRVLRGRLFINLIVRR